MTADACNLHALLTFTYGNLQFRRLCKKMQLTPITYAVYAATY